jgi:uncharacterized protein (DUF1697 family)
MTAKMEYIALLRGINVGGHHKVPMAALCSELNAIGLLNIRTLLNSGNVVFDTTEPDRKVLQARIETRLSETFGFSIPVVIKRKSEITYLVEKDPFDKVVVNKDIRLYVTFLKNEDDIFLNIPWISEDASYKIIAISNGIIFSVLDLTLTKTPKGMEELERIFGKAITTRNWNTILKLLDI